LYVFSVVCEEKVMLQPEILPTVLVEYILPRFDLPINLPVLLVDQRDLQVAVLNPEVLHELLVLRDLAIEFLAGDDFLEAVLELDAVVQDELFDLAFLVVDEVEVELRRMRSAEDKLEPTFSRNLFPRSSCLTE